MQVIIKCFKLQEECPGVGEKEGTLAKNNAMSLAIDLLLKFMAPTFYILDPGFTLGGP